jgi:hypothetical protein
MVRGFQSRDIPPLRAAPTWAWLLVAAVALGVVGFWLVPRAVELEQAASVADHKLHVVPRAGESAANPPGPGAASVAGAAATAPEAGAVGVPAAVAASRLVPPGQGTMVEGKTAVGRSPADSAPSGVVPAGRAISFLPTGNEETDEDSVRRLVESALLGQEGGGARDGLDRMREAFASATDVETKNELLSVALELARRQSLNPAGLLAVALRDDQPEDVRHAALYYLQQSDPVLLEEFATSADEALSTHARGYLRQMLVNRGILRAPQELTPETELILPGPGVP